MLFSLKIYNWPICLCSLALDYQVVPSHYHSGLRWCCVLQQGQSSWSQFSKQHFVPLWGLFMEAMSTLSVLQASVSWFFSQALFFCKHSCARTELPSTCLEFAFLHLAQFRWFGPSQRKRDPRPACSFSLLWVQLVLCTWSGPAVHRRESSHGQAMPLGILLLAEQANCKKHFLQCLCFLPFSPFPKVMLFNVGEKDAACLGHWAVCWRAKTTPVHMPQIKSHRAKFRPWTYRDTEQEPRPNLVLSLLSTQDTLTCNYHSKRAVWVLLPAAWIPLHCSFLWQHLFLCTPSHGIPWLCLA